MLFLSVVLHLLRLIDEFLSAMLLEWQTADLSSPWYGMILKAASMAEWAVMQRTCAVL